MSYLLNTEGMTDAPFQGATDEDFVTDEIRTCYPYSRCLVRNVTASHFHTEKKVNSHFNIWYTNNILYFLYSRYRKKMTQVSRKKTRLCNQLINNTYHSLSHGRGITFRPKAWLCPIVFINSILLHFV